MANLGIEEDQHAGRPKEDRYMLDDARSALSAEAVDLPPPDTGVERYGARGIPESGRTASVPLIMVGVLA